MFQLEHELRKWTSRIDRLESMRDCDIEELEQHVRDSITELTPKGLTEEEAFLVATHRVGEPIAVGREFGKVNGDHAWARRVFWMLAGFLFFEVCQMAITAVAGFGQVLAALVGGDGTVMGYVSVGITALCWLGLAIGFYRRTATQNDGYFVGRFLSQAPGRVLGIGVVLIVVLTTLTKLGSQITVTSMTPIGEIGEAALIAAWAHTLFTLLIPLTFLWVMMSIRVSMRDAVAAEH